MCISWIQHTIFVISSCGSQTILLRLVKALLHHTYFIGAVEHFINNPVVCTIPKYLPIYQLTKISCHGQLYRHTDWTITVLPCLWIRNDGLAPVARGQGTTVVRIGKGVCSFVPAHDCEWVSLGDFSKADIRIRIRCQHPDVDRPANNHFVVVLLQWSVTPVWVPWALWF